MVRKPWIGISFSSFCLLALVGSLSPESRSNGIQAVGKDNLYLFPKVRFQREEEKPVSNLRKDRRLDTQVTTQKSFFDRIGESLVSVVVGLILFFVAPCLLFWNEGRTVRRMKQISYLAENTKEGISSFNEGSLVHVVGWAAPRSNGQSVQDPVFGIPPVSSEILDMLVLQREVKMFQWVEHQRSETKKTAGGGEETTTYYEYSREWRSSPIDSSTFQESHHYNPPMRYRDETWYCPEGAQLQVNENGDNKAISQLADKLLHQVPADQTYDTSVLGKPAEMRLIGDSYGSNSYSNEDPRWVSDTALHFGAHPVDVGTHEVQWRYSRSRTVSIVAKLSGEGLIEWQHPKDTGFTVCRLVTGEKTLEQIVEIMEAENKCMMWGLRILGCFLWIIALQMMAKPLEVLFDLGTIPFLGVEPGTIISYLTGFASVLSGLGLSLVVIAVAWLVYRPLYGILLLAAAAGLFFLLHKEEGEDTAASAPMNNIVKEGGTSCPGGSMVSCTNTCKDLMDNVYKACIETCLNKCA